jgi:hypothetical protein
MKDIFSKSSGRTQQSSSSKSTFYGYKVIISVVGWMIDVEVQAG